MTRVLTKATVQRRQLAVAKRRVLGVGPEPQGVAQRLQELMRAQGILPVELAEQLGVSAGYVSRLLKGTRAWTLNLVVQCAAIFKVAPAELAPTAPEDLKQTLLDLEVSGEQLPAVAAFVACMPRIRSRRHVEALVTTLEAMAEINTRTPEVFPRGGWVEPDAHGARFLPLAQGARVVEDPECA